MIIEPGTPANGETPDYYSLSLATVFLVFPLMFSVNQVFLLLYYKHVYFQKPENPILGYYAVSVFNIQ